MDGPDDPYRPPTVQRPLRQVLPWLAFAAAIAATVALVASRGEDLDSLANVGAPAVAGLVALQVTYLIVQSGRFHVVLVHFARRPVGFVAWTKVFVLGRFLNLFVPQAGNVYRAVELRRVHGVTVQDFLVAFVNAPWLAMVLNFGFGAIGIAWLARDAALYGAPLWVWFVAATLATSLAPFVALAVLPLLPRRWTRVAWLRDRLSEMVQVTLASLRDVRYLTGVTAWTLASFVQATVMMWFGFRALGSDVGAAEAVAFYVLLQLATYVQITPGNLGVQEFAFAGLSAAFGATAVDGVLVSTIVRVTGVIALLAAALPWGGVEALQSSRSAGTRGSS